MLWSAIKWCKRNWWAGSRGTSSHRWSGMDSLWMIFIRDLNEIRVGTLCSFLSSIISQPAGSILTSVYATEIGDMVSKNWDIMPLLSAAPFLSIGEKWRLHYFKGNGSWDEYAASFRKRIAFNSALLFWNSYGIYYLIGVFFTAKDFFK